MRVEVYTYKNGVKVYKIHDKYVAVYDGEAYGVGNSITDALIEAEKNYEGENNPFTSEAIGHEQPKKEYDILTPIFKFIDVDVYEIPPLYLVVHNNKVKGYAFGYFDDAIREAIANDPDILYKVYDMNEW